MIYTLVKLKLRQYEPIASFNSLEEATAHVGKKARHCKFISAGYWFLWGGSNRYYIFKTEKK